MNELKRTALYDAHVAAGATMVDFGGWDMPIQYPAGIVSEHLYTRSNCGIFDVSHMGRLIVEGPDRVKFLQKVLTSNVEALTMNRAQYCIISNENGGAVDDAYLYMYEEDRYLLVVNASNTDKDLAHFAAQIEGFDCTITNATAMSASIAVQGPKSEEIMRQLTGEEFITNPTRNSLNIMTAEGRTIWVSRTGYTGEPIGYELFVAAADAQWLWDRLLELGARPTGLGARDTLRLEAGLPLYGHEMGDDNSGKEIPIYAVPLARFAVSLVDGKPELIGRAALEAQKAEGTEKRMVAITLVDRGVMRAGMTILRGEDQIGWVTSGTMVPYYNMEGEGETLRQLETTGKRSIGFAYVTADVKTGDIVEVDVRGKKLKAAVVANHMRGNLPPYAIPVIYK